MGSYTTNLNLYKPNTGETDWGDEINNNFDILDTEITALKLQLAKLLSTCISSVILSSDNMLEIEIVRVT